MAMAVLTAVWASQFAWVSPTNFSGTDEWLYLSLTSRGIIDFPHTQRPLTLLWTLPGALLRHRFVGFHLVDGAYLLLSGWLVFLIARRLAPGDALTALSAGVFALVWAPRDMARLLTVQTTVNTGVTAAGLLALVLLLESWVRRRAVLLGLAAAVAFVASRSYEAVVPLLLAGPVLILWVGVRSRRAWLWAGVFGGVVILGGAVTALALRRSGVSYQLALGFDARPWPVVGRLARQFGFDVLPLLTPAPGLGGVGVLAAVAVFAIGYGLLAASSSSTRSPAASDAPTARARLARLAALGALLAALGYLPFCLLASTQSATRTQFLSRPGIALLLAATATLLGSFVPARGRRAAAGLLGAWVVALGTANTIAMQGLWTEMSSYPAQTGLLRQLTARAPDVRPHTLIVLLDEGGVFPAVFAFRHAVGYLYEQRAAGLVWGASDYLYTFTFDAEGVWFDPWPAIRRAWRDEPTRYAYGEVIVARGGADGRLALLRDWPPELPPLPRSARYEPEARIVRGGPPVRAQAILYEQTLAVRDGVTSDLMRHGASAR